jgi:hypothetical protein
MKVLVISAAFPPMRAGEAEHTIHLCRHLSENGTNVIRDGWRVIKLLRSKSWSTPTN